MPDADRLSEPDGEVKQFVVNGREPLVVGQHAWWKQLLENLVTLLGQQAVGVRTDARGVVVGYDGVDIPEAAVVEDQRLQAELPVGQNFVALVVGVPNQEFAPDDHGLVGQAAAHQVNQRDVVLMVSLRLWVAALQHLAADNVSIVYGGFCQGSGRVEAVARVHENAIFAVSLGHALVHGVVDAVVLFGNPVVDAGLVRLDDVHATVGRASVNDQVLVVAACLAHDARNRPGQTVAVVVVDGYDGILHRYTLIFRQS